MSTTPTAPVDPVAAAEAWAGDLRRAREELTLEELLRRCHRDELLPLAESLNVNPDGLGTGHLAKVISSTLRRAGAHELKNLVLRRGEGPGYPQVLRGLAGRIDAEAQPTLERTELAIMRAWLDRAAKDLEPDQRAELLAVFEQAGEATAAITADLHPVAAAPEQAGLPATVASSPPPEGPPRARPDRLFAASTVLRAAPLFLPLLAPITVVAGAWWLGRPKDRLLLPAVLEVARLRQMVRHRVTVGVVGSPSSGKDAAIKALFGIDTGNVNPVAGSTKQVTIQRLEGARALYVVNTPGLGDIVEAVTEEARQVLHHIDVFVYIVNAQGGVQAREKTDYRACLSMGRPVLAVVNKIDTLRPRDRDRYLADAAQKLGAPDDAFLAAAFDPLPQLSEHPIGVDAVQAWLTHRLVELGKDPTELPWVPSHLDAEVRPPGAMEQHDGDPVPA